MKSAHSQTCHALENRTGIAAHERNAVSVYRSLARRGLAAVSETRAQAERRERAGHPRSVAHGRREDLADLRLGDAGPPGALAWTLLCGGNQTRHGQAHESASRYPVAGVENDRR